SPLPITSTLKPIRCHPPTKSSAIFFYACQTHAFGIAQNRHNQSFTAADGNPNVAIIVENQVRAAYLRVDLGHEFKRLDGSLDEEGHESELNLMLYPKCLSVFFT